MQSGYSSARGDEVTRYFSALREEWPEVTQAMRVLTHWVLRALYVVWAGLCVYCLYKGDRRSVRRVVLFALVQIAVTMLMVQAVKWTVGRPRPLLALKGVGYVPFVSANSSHSFPSGHTAEASGAGSALALWTRSP
ncbi:phosphatase PAP2 family protein, partial [Desulfovibrio sp. OttesenSCG-928-G15]|nr:phosphatase PAP2 family protein [Desulfovibrio sp. OttesenSCG-928-G15]